MDGSVYAPRRRRPRVASHFTVRPLEEMVREMRAMPRHKNKISSMKALRRKVQRERVLVSGVRWSGRQWTRYRKAVARGEVQV